MIGEIRDSETAELAFRAAQTGHFIISTLHTNDAVGAVNRLKDLGVDANVGTSALLGVMSQRLVRQICWNCKQQYEPSRQLLESVFDVPPTGFAWYRGAGCDECLEAIEARKPGSGMKDCIAIEGGIRIGTLLQKEETELGVAAV